MNPATAPAATEVRWSAAAVAEAIGLPHRPTPEQTAVIEAPLRPLLVIAGAGSGKTETMAARVVWLVANGFVEPEDVLGLTFTRKAATELSDRIGNRLAQLRRVGLWTPQEVDGAPSLGAAVSVSTYHSYAGRLVREHGLRLGYEADTRLLSEAAAWQTAHEAVVRYDGPMDEVDKAESTVTAAVVDLAGEMAEHLQTPESVAAHLDRVIEHLEQLERGDTKKRVNPVAGELTNLRLRRAVLPIVGRYAELKRSRDAMDFADQMALAAQLAMTFDDIGAIERARHRVVLLDEFQDTSEAQLALLKALYVAPGETSAVTAVGDPHQSIYGWRGASATTLTRFAVEFGDPDPAQKLDLSTSWRNDSAVLAVANHLAQPLRAASRVKVEPLASRPGAGVGAVEVARLTTAADEADHIARWLATHRSRGAVSAAVLCRKRAEFATVTAALEEHGIPHEVVGLGGLLLTPEVEDVVALLHVVQDPARGDHLVRLLSGPMMRLGIADLDALAAWSRVQQRLRGGAVARHEKDLAPDAANAPSIIEALDSLPPRGWVGDEGERLSDVARDRLAGLAATVRRMRGLTFLPLADLVLEAEKALGLDIEVLSRPEYTPAAARAHLDAFGDVAAQFSQSADRATLGGFLDWIKAAIDEERGLDRGYADATPDAVQVMTIHAAKGLEWDVVAVPALVESTFPAHNLHSPSFKDGQWRISAPKDKGWLAGLQDGGLPYELRGDRDGLPEFGWRSAVGWDELAARLEEFAVSGGEHAVAEERRLAYVAATRARHALLLTASVWSRPKTPRVTSRFLDEVRELASVEGSPVRILEWVDLPVPPEDGSPLVKPGTEDGHEFVWPVDHLGHRRVRADAAARAVTEASEGPESTSATVGPWARELDLLLAERARRASRHDDIVELPSHLSTSSLVAFATDPERFAAELRRPMPSAPAQAARRGTAFHAWIEEHYARAAIVDLFDLPGSADEDPMGDAELPAMRERFLESPWAAREPIEIETALETVVDGVAIRGRIDAVFADVEGSDWVIVDWKTGRKPSGEVARMRALQLAAYRIAWARLRGVDPQRVSGGFYYAGTGETVWPVLADEAEISDLLGGVPRA
ncbi:putative DNA helicase [Janibacter sp. HTCC2649]|uniref:ATP-dependent helicase n=1 Tax=Janibacter sp. HTCC2649 TaxID=313589 RepID=UPI0000670D15|nr:ATP-dependent DNA helicase [Janibacter sp. HTCC2649]EAP99981.1 putative DNA helicase [Janibacter sp. HTCC2649]